MAKHILVTGATGTVGGEVVRQLKGQDANIRLGLRQTKKISGADTVTFDYTNRDTFKEALSGCEKLFLVAPPSRQNFDALGDLLEVAHQMGVQHIVGATGMGADRFSETTAGLFDSLVRQSPVSWTILRPNWFMQNFFTYFRSEIISKGEIFLPAADATTSFVDVRDIASVAVTALLSNKHRDQAFTLTGGESLSHREVASVLSQHLLRPVVYRSATEDGYSASLRSQGFEERDINEMLRLFEVVRQGEHAPVHDDIERLLERPPHTFHQFVIDHVTRWQE